MAPLVATFTSFSQGLDTVMHCSSRKETMASAAEPWQPSRLIPVSGLSGADEQERRGASAFLAVLGSVKEFGRAVTSRLGAPAGIIDTFIEVPFLLGEANYRPDGLIRVSRGQRDWTTGVIRCGRSARAEHTEAGGP